MTATAGADPHTINLRDGIPERDGSEFEYVGSGFLAMGDKATDIVGADSYTLTTEVSGETAQRLITEAEAAGELSFGEGSNLAINKHKTLTNVKIEDGLDSTNHDDVTVFVRVAPDSDVKGSEIAARHGEIQDESNDASSGTGDDQTTDPPTDPSDGITEAVALDQSDNRVYDAAEGRVLAVQRDQIQNSDGSTHVSSSPERSAQSNPNESSVVDTNTSDAVEERRNELLQHAPPGNDPTSNEQRHELGSNLLTR
ncbi:MAG: hypothetical protein U5K28_01770 [Halobacteriales archaeon]|nr:hypothetical protein [Halobacteriales archaeon]